MAVGDDDNDDDPGASGNGGGNEREGKGRERATGNIERSGSQTKEKRSKQGEGTPTPLYKDDWYLTLSNDDPNDPNEGLGITTGRRVPKRRQRRAGAVKYDVHDTIEAVNRR